MHNNRHTKSKHFFFCIALVHTTAIKLGNADIADPSVKFINTSLPKQCVKIINKQEIKKYT